MGSERNRSISPCSKSLFRPSAVLNPGNAMPWIRIPGSANCRYSWLEPGDRAAEHVDEQHQEHERLDRHAGELLGVGLDADQVAPRDDPRVADRLAESETPAARRLGALRRLSCALSSVSSSRPRPSARCPVSGEEHLVEARAAQRQVVDGDARPRRAPDDLRRGPSGRRPARVTSSLVAVRCCRRRPANSARTLARRPCRRVGRADLQDLAADLRLELVARFPRRSPGRGRSRRCGPTAGRPRPGTGW